MDYILETHALTKRYGAHRAVDGVTLHVKKGAIYGLIGRNGAGKTTLLKMLAGLARPTEGTYSLFGEADGTQAIQLGRVGTLIESPGLYPNMSAEDNLQVRIRALGVRDRGIADRLLESVGLQDAGKKSVKKYSMGMKQRLGIALALVGDPDILLLDEPINGLDPQGIVEMREILSKLNREKHITIVISSHILEELSKIATGYGIIHQGKIMEELSSEELLEKGGEHIELKTDDTRKACTVLESMAITQYKVVDNDTIRIYERLQDAGNITMALADNSVRILAITVKNEGLESYYLNLTGGGAHA